MGAVYFPRTAHLDLYTDAYTPSRTKYNLAIVGTIAGVFTFYEVNFELMIKI